MKYFLSIILLLSSIVSWSQFCTQTEIKYLQIVNQQKNKELIEGNIINAEHRADSILYYGKSAYLNSLLFYELSRSYALIGQYDFALLTLYKQKILFPNDSISKISEQLFSESIFRNQYTEIELDSIQQYIASIPENFSYNKRYNILLKIAAEIRSKALISQIYNMGYRYELLSNHAPIWFQHWQFLSMINIKEKHKMNLVNETKSNNKPIYQQIKNPRLDNKVYRKAIKYYIKSDALRQAQIILNEYKTKPRSFFLKFDSYIKQVRINTKI